MLIHDFESIGSLKTNVYVNISCVIDKLYTHYIYVYGGVMKKVIQLVNITVTITYKPSYLGI